MCGRVLSGFVGGVRSGYRIARNESGKAAGGLAPFQKVRLTILTRPAPVTRPRRNTPAPRLDFSKKDI